MNAVSNSLTFSTVSSVFTGSLSLDALRALFKLLDPSEVPTSVGDAAPPVGVTDLSSLIDTLGQADHGLIMVMGKGGVGKTTIAAAVAVALAQRGKPVQLTTTDPAQHIADTLQVAVPNLTVDFIDPKTEVRRYRERTLEAAKSKRS